MAICKHCHHPEHQQDCARDECGCIRFEPVNRAARDARRKQFLVRVAFLVRGGWTSDVEVRVRAQTMTGAAMRGVQTARRIAVKPRSRVSEARLVVIAC